MKFVWSVESPDSWKNTGPARLWTRLDLEATIPSMIAGTTTFWITPNVQ